MQGLAEKHCAPGLTSTIQYDINANTSRKYFLIPGLNLSAEIVSRPGIPHPHYLFVISKSKDVFTTSLGGNWLIK